MFIKPINADNNLLAKQYSSGSGFYTNDLRLLSDSTANGLTMEQFYIDYVYDYGIALKDLVAKKTPNSLAGVPNLPILNPNNFKVVQVNKHLTDTPDANLIKQKYNLESKEYRFFNEKENKYLRTQKYIFTKLNLN